MAYEFKLPDLGEGIHEGELRKWLVKEGDAVQEHQPIAEIETDKAVVELPSPKTGRILKLNFKEGETMRVGDVVVVIGEEGEKAAAPAPAPSAPRPVAPALSIPPPRRIAKGATGAVGELEEAPDEEEEPARKPGAPVSPVAMVEALPAVRKLAQELSVDLAKVHGTGPGGRITDADVKNAAGKGPPAAVVRAGPRITFEDYGRVLRIPLKGLRKTISENLTRAFQTTVPVTHMDEVDVTELAELRQKKKKLAEDKGYPLTYLPFIAKAAVIALKEHPYVNSSLDDSTGEIVVKQYYNIGFAVDTTDGLIVPVVKGCDQKSILEIAKDLYMRAEETRNREIKLEDLKGGTFTITNIGTIGGGHATPIINHPECAILALGAITDKAVVREGQIVIRKILPLSLTFDHRIIDGAETARFVNDLKKHLEDPSLMLLEAF
jgi:pyruvate dehydrogenase E2 component (dihydrolipoamide acetyltransferase)